MNFIRIITGCYSEEKTAYFFGYNKIDQEQLDQLTIKNGIKAKNLVDRWNNDPLSDKERVEFLYPDYWADNNALWFKLMRNDLQTLGYQLIEKPPTAVMNYDFPVSKNDIERRD